MNFDDFVKDGRVRKASIDKEMTKSLVRLTLNDLKYLRTQKVDELSARKLVVSYYDSLRAILEAVAVLEGYKIYQHEAFTYYLQNRGEIEKAIKFDRLRKIRNGIGYYGKNIDVEEAKEVILEIKYLIEYFIEKYLKEFRVP